MEYSTPKYSRSSSILLPASLRVHRINPLQMCLLLMHRVELSQRNRYETGTSVCASTRFPGTKRNDATVGIAFLVRFAKHT